MRWKDSCRFVDFAPQLDFALRRVETFFQTHNTEMWITSLNDGKHREGSKHYAGAAADIRSRNLPDIHGLKEQLAKKINAALGPHFDFILEYLGEANEHFHLEYDPKEPY